jgi:putative glycerol-1-phosphate prenyltransferase
MKLNSLYQKIVTAKKEGQKLLAILLDPDKIHISKVEVILQKLPPCDFLFIGGSEVEDGKTELLVKILKSKTHLPLILFPGDVNQITSFADAILYLSLMSGNNPEYLIHQQVKAVPKLKNTSLEIIPTAYILIDGGKVSAVERVSQTEPISQKALDLICDTAKAAEYAGKQLIYLEAGSGAKYHIDTNIINKVRQTTHLPIIVGGGIKTEAQTQNIYNAGADLIVIGTAFE